MEFVLFGKWQCCSFLSHFPSLLALLFSVSLFQRRRAIEALEARAPPQTVWQLLIVYRTELKSITVCITLNANTGKIVLVTLCIQIEWLFYIMLSGVNL